MLLPDAQLSLTRRDSTRLGTRARHFGVAVGYLWQEPLLPPEVVTSRQTVEANELCLEWGSAPSAFLLPA